MPETIQDLDQPNTNPLAVDLDSTDITPAKKTFNFPKDPKVIVLIVMGIIILILLVLSLIIGISRQPHPNTTPPVSITISPTLIPSPETINVPTVYQQQFKILDSAIQEKINFPLPQIDPSVGIIPNQ